MRKLLLILIFCCILSQGVCAQNNGLERDSLPVFVIQDKELSAFVDDFIAKAEIIDYHAPTEYHIYISLSDIDSTDEVHFLLDRRKQPISSDSIIIYKNPHYHQAFIRHEDKLFITNIRSYTTSFNYYLLTEMLNVLPKKQVVYFKNPPSDYYDLNRRGGNPFEDTVLDSLFEYDGKEWHKGITMYEDDIEDEWIICR